MQKFFKLAFLLLVVSCSRPSTPDNGASPDAETAIIEGVVRELDTERPIAGVNVFVVRTSDRPQLRTTTDADGRFALGGLEGGRHLVAVVREGYVLPGRVEISGYPFRLSARQHLADVVFHLIPAGTIAGRIIRADGKPAARVEVQFLQNLYVMGQRQWVATGLAGSSRGGRIQTNERGEFRATGVDPGDYAIRFVPHETTIESVVPGGKSPSPILYPGVHDISKATVVSVNPGKETLLKDFVMPDETRGWARVLVINESGESLEGFGDWRVEPPGWIGVDYPLFEKRIVNSSHDIRPDWPGTYDVRASWSTRKGPVVGTLRVTYRGTDVDSKLTLRPPRGSLTGRVTLQEKEGSPGPPLTGVEVAIGPQIPYFARSGPDGVLKLSAVYEGRYKLGYVRGLPADTFVSSVRQGNRDVFREELVVGNGETTLELVVSPGAGVVEGKVSNAKGQPVHNALVALVPESPLRDRVDYYGAYHDTRTDQNGAFEIRGITPGSYQAFAWSNAPASAFRNSEFMKDIEGKGKALKLDIGGRSTLDLAVID